ncbi:hypothetical protein K439DRAFT_1377211 [Ramaria rubella]|nr:hypothetical protein K439DRAFT_1377211 [Ramaria rubella]
MGSRRAKVSPTLFVVIILDILSRPRNPQELFNLRHASARNVVEWIFGVLKWRFRVLVHPPEYSLAVQARVPAALAAVHNYIRLHDPLELEDFEDVHDPHPGSHFGSLALGPPCAAERKEAKGMHEKIAQAMFTQCKQTLQERGV